MLRALRGRATELRRLSGSIATPAPQLVVLSGPRRVGKTLLVQHALAAVRGRARTLYFEATQAGERAELRRFDAALRAVVGDVLPGGPTPSSWEHALQLAAFAARAEPLVVAIDEATYLMGSTPGFASQVQVVWDALTALAEPPRLAIVLTGSAVGLMEDALSSRGALYQRPTLSMRLRPFTAYEAHAFTGRPGAVRLFEAYGACGGYPLHLDAWDFDRPTDDNLLELAGQPGALLVEDGAHVVAHLSDPMRRVLIAVGQGRSRPSEIANEVGARPERAIDGLVHAGLVRAALPLAAPLKARAQLRIDDAYLRFWFRVIANHVQQIEAGQGREVLRATNELWQGHLGWVFEQAAREHAVRLVATGELPEGTLVDEWWTASGQQHQVDVLGIADHRTVMLGEAKWSSRPLGQARLDALAAKRSVVPSPVAQPHYLLWGRGGVRGELLVGNVRGFDAEAMLAEG